MPQDSRYKYKFSLICAVYNVEEYVAETLDSFIAQDIGFKENVQVILVNDGSRDGSGTVCDEYAAKYPDNIVVVHKENGGVSSARNTGLGYIEGKYYNFCDPDDILTPNTLSSVWSFFEAHEDETDVVTIPMYFFEAYTGTPYHHSKFLRGTRLINLEEEPYAPLFSSSSSFIHSRMKDKFSFDSRLSFSEDAKYVQQILLCKKTLGVVAECKYMYRRRLSNTSAINSSQSDDRWYFDTPKYFFLEIIDYAKGECGYLPKFIQHTMLCDIKWRLIQKASDNKYLGRNGEKFDEYFSLIVKILSNIEDEVIMTNEFYDDALKLFVLSDVKKRPITTETLDGRSYYTLDGAPLFETTAMCALEYQTFEANGDSALLTFAVTRPSGSGEYRFVMTANGEELPMRQIRCEEQANLHLVTRLKLYYEIELPLADKPITLEVLLDDGVSRAPLAAKLFGKFFPLNTVKTSYYAFGKRKLTKSGETTLRIAPVTALGKFFSELRYAFSIIGLKSPRGYKVVAYRAIYFLSHLFLRKKRWLLMDRINKADDNAEALFAHLKNNPERRVKPVFAVARGESYDRLRSEYGDVVEYNTKKYYIQYLVSDVVISSHVDDFIRRPLGWKQVYVKDITVGKKFVFLQHGISQNDISAYLNRFSKNVSGLVIAASTERELFADEKYGYSESKIWATGFARFDRLYGEEAPRLVTVMPTWRSYLATSMNGETGVWNLVSDFRDSAFYSFYNSLLNDERLIEAANEYGYKLCFMPHPILAPHLDLFEKNEAVVFMNPETSYREVYARSALILTDYSSAAFDFSYLRRPVVYAQFDREEMKARATTYSLNTDFYDKHALGEICRDYETTVSTLVDYMKNGCLLKPEYSDAIDGFFLFDDKRSSERIIERIKGL